MSSPAVAQLPALAELFQRVLDRWLPASVAVLGIAGGNGLERIDSSVTKKIVGVDINEHYLETVERRFEALPGLELYCRDLTVGDLGLPPVMLVHAALIFEHVGLGVPLDNAVALVGPGGTLSVVLQLPSTEEQDIAATNYASMQALKYDFALIDRTAFQEKMAATGFQLVDQEHRPLAGGKAFWLGVFSRVRDCHPAVGRPQSHIRRHRSTPDVPI
jgi:hypothetical protein